MGQRAFRIDHVTGERSLVTRPLTVGRLDRDHIGAELGQDVSGELAAIIAEIKDSIGREHSSPYQPDDNTRLSMFAISPNSTTPTTNVPARQRGASVYGMTGRVTITLPVIAVAALECDVLGLLVAGLPNEGIAHQLGIKAKTIVNHVERALHDSQHHLDDVRGLAARGLVEASRCNAHGAAIHPAVAGVRGRDIRPYRMVPRKTSSCRVGRVISRRRRGVRRLGCPDEEAVALAASDDPDDLRPAFERFDHLGARPAAATRRIRARGI